VNVGKYLQETTVPHRDMGGQEVVSFKFQQLSFFCVERELVSVGLSKMWVRGMCTGV
jgi:hypothetical protein